MSLSSVKAADNQYVDGNLSLSVKKESILSESHLEPEESGLFSHRYPHQFPVVVGELQWGSFLVALLYYVIVYAITSSSPPSTRYYDNYDPKISLATGHPFKESSTVNYASMIVFFIIFWFVSVVLFEISFIQNFKNLFSHRLKLLLCICNLSFGWFEAVCYTIASTKLVKNSVGFLRPDFNQRCFGNSLPSSLENWTCTNKDIHLIKEGRKSFPSGHTSTGFCMAFYISLYLFWGFYLRRTSIWVPKSSNSSQRQSNSGVWLATIKQFLFGFVLLPILLAGYVGVTRVTDFQHHPVDVAVGAMIGILISSLVFFRTCSHVTKNEEEYSKN